MLISGLSSTPTIRPVSRAPVAESQPVTRAGNQSSVEAADRVTREQGAQAPISVQRVDPSRQGESSQRARPAAQSGAEAQNSSVQQLSEAERRQVEDLKARDREVRAHEAAHQAAAGSYAGPIQYEFQRGPDGRRYAVGGSVQIDTSPIPDDPEATIQKMETIRAAALAPANPSAQDQSVAARAQQQILQARAELTAQRSEQIGAVDSAEPAAFTGTATALASRNGASSSESGLSESINLSPGASRDAVMAFREVEQYGRGPAMLPPDARLAVDMYA